MTVAKALKQRRSIRKFLDKKIPEPLMKSIFTTAQLSPSNCNVQPWQSIVVSGNKKEALKEALLIEVTNGTPANPDFDWGIKYQGIHRERQFGAANALYGAMEIAREDKKSRHLALLRNWEFFDAPHVVFFTMDARLGMMSAVDIGIYAQSLALLFAEKGIGSCLQGALGQFPNPVRKVLNLPENQGVLFGMSFGYIDNDSPINKVTTKREIIDKAVCFIG
ncbi:nitroreductase [Gammaproteobacteria bacterium 42_54_T18]|nr:nitroreductase [Gammaproteobacteria bacterium 42_54_T18]